MGEELSLEELSRRTGEPVARLRRWRSRGLIGSPDADGFAPEDVERGRLVQLLLRRGIDLEAIAKAAKDGMLDRYVQILFPGGVGPTYSLAQAAEMLGLDLEPVRRVWVASGLAEQGEIVREADLEGLRLFQACIDAGFPAAALIEGTRVYADALGRVAEMEARLFHFYIHERLRAEGLSGEELRGAVDAAGERAMPLVEPLVLFFHRKGWEKAVREDAVMHLAEESGLVERGEVPGQLQAAIVFVDLSSFTALTEAMGDVKAAEVLDRFSALVRESVGRWDGRVVKQIGDAFMLVFPGSRSAVACCLEVKGRAAAEAQFPAVRIGAHWGRVLYREGDYLGFVVNVAARLAEEEAERNQFLVTGPVRREAKGLDGVEFVRVGKRRLKGLAEELELFEARSAGVAAGAKVIDPVCGMELGPAEVAAQLALEGRQRAFCSEECLRRFVAGPERYAGQNLEPRT